VSFYEVDIHTNFFRSNVTI